MPITQPMKIAMSMAELGAANGEVPVGAVIVEPVTGKIIASCHNLVERNQDPTAHAEMLAIKTACGKLANKYLNGLDLYVTLQPCPMCLQAAAYARIRRIYFAAYDPTAPLQLPIVSNHLIEIYGGIDEERAKALLNQFFASKR